MRIGCGLAAVVGVAATFADARAQVISEPPPVEAPSPDWEQGLEIAPVESVDLPFDRSQLSLTARGTSASELDGTSYRDGSIVLAGAVSLYSRLRIEPGSFSGLRLMAQFRVEGERVSAEMLGNDQQVTKAALGLTMLYLSPKRRLYAVYAGVAIAETRHTLSDPDLLPTAIALGTTSMSSKLTWIYGGGFGYAFGRPWIVPALGLMWRIGAGWTLTTIAPIFVDVRKQFSSALAANLFVAVSGDRFNFTNDGEFAGAADTLQLQMGQGKLGLGMTYRLTRRWSLRGELGVVGPRRLKIVDGDTTVMTAEGNGAGYLGTTVTYGFGSSL